MLLNSRSPDREFVRGAVCRFLRIYNANKGRLRSGALAGIRHYGRRTSSRYMTWDAKTWVNRVLRERLVCLVFADRIVEPGKDRVHGEALSSSKGGHQVHSKL